MFYQEGSHEGGSTGSAVHGGRCGGFAPVGGKQLRVGTLGWWEIRDLWTTKEDEGEIEK